MAIVIALIPAKIFFCPLIRLVNKFQRFNVKFGVVDVLLERLMNWNFSFNIYFLDGVAFNSLIYYWGKKNIRASDWTAKTSPVWFYLNK